MINAFAYFILSQTRIYKPLFFYLWEKNRKRYRQKSINKQKQQLSASDSWLMYCGGLFYPSTITHRCLLYYICLKSKKNVFGEEKSLIKLCFIYNTHAIYKMVHVGGLNGRDRFSGIKQTTTN